LLADRQVVVAHHAELVSAAAAAAAGLADARIRADAEAAGTAEKIRVMDMAMAALEAELAEARQQVGHLTQALKEEHEHTQQEVRHVMEELNASHAAEIAVIRDALLAAEAEHAKDKAEAAARQGLELVDVLAKAEARRQEELVALAKEENHKLQSRLLEFEAHAAKMEHRLEQAMLHVAEVDELPTSGRAELQALKTTTDSSRRVSALASGNIFPHALQSTSSSAGIAAAVSAAAAEHAAQHGMEGVDVQLFKVRTELAAVQQELEARTTQFELQLQASAVLEDLKSLSNSDLRFRRRLFSNCLARGSTISTSSFYSRNGVGSP